MTPSEHEPSADERFERLLLASAESDELPSHVDAAWRRFDGALTSVSLLAAGREGALTARRAQRWLAAKWLLAGAIAGSALTALSFGVSQVQPALPATKSPAVSAPSIASFAPVPRAQVIEEPIASARQSPPKRAPRSPRASQPESSREAVSAANSTLAAQVAMLDAARAALSSGALAEALRLAERYRDAFPNGELAPEAELVAIEVLVEQGARPLAVQRATRFLARYPGDPHTARVKWLMR